MPERSTFKSLTRLAIGGLLVGLDGLAHRLEIWETELHPSPPPVIIDGATGPAASLASGNAPEPVPGFVAPAASHGEAGVPAVGEPSARSTGFPLRPTGFTTEQAEDAPSLRLSSASAPTHPVEHPPAAPSDRPISIAEPYPDPDTTADLVVYALVGMVFHGQEKLEAYIGVAERATRVVGNWGDFMFGPLVRSRWTAPLRRTVDDLADQGRQQLDGWIATGRKETDYSRRLVQIAVTERVDNAIDFLTGSPDVKELVQSQSANLVDEVIEETRERTVSADNYLEALVRAVFRRPPRWELPDSPPLLKSIAQSHGRTLHGRTVDK